MAEQDKKAAQAQADAERQAAEQAAAEQAAREAAEQAERDRQSGDGGETDATDVSERRGVPAVHGESDNAVSVAQARRGATAPNRDKSKGPLDDPDFGGQVAGSGGFGAPAVYAGQDTSGPTRPTRVTADNPGLGATASEKVEGDAVEALAHAGEADVRRISASQAAQEADARGNG